MPTLTQEPPNKAVQPLFIGLQSYTEAQSEQFYGRDDEIDRLTNLVKANTLTIVFGKSGTGKTSLLNAGVFPRLRKDYCLPFRIRLEFSDDSPDLVTQIKNTLSAEIDKYGFKVESYPSTQTLWEYFHQEQLWKSVTPILIFDQFEEIFTLGKKSQRFGAKELADFWEELADLIENSIPEKLKDHFLNQKEEVTFNYKAQKVKTLFSFREEFLPEFESITAKIPSIKYSRFRLMPMNGDQAYQVITKTWKEKIYASEAHKIVGFFASEQEKDLPYEALEIEPSLLSQVCSFIDRERLLQGMDKMSAEFLNKYPKDIILSSIYYEVLTESNAAIIGNSQSIDKPSVSAEKPVNEFIEDKLITDEGYRTKYVLSVQDEKIKPGIEVLKAKYFVRDDGKSVELTHDVLTPLIKRDREARRKSLAMAIAKRKATRRAVYIVGLALTAAVVIWYLTANEAIQKKKQAEKEYAALEQKLKKDSASLASLEDSIKVKQKNLKNIGQERGATEDGSGGTNGDTSISRVTDTIQDLLLQKGILTVRQTELENEKSALESSIAKKNKEIDDFINYQRRLDSANIDAKRSIRFLQERLRDNLAALEATTNRYNNMVKFHNDYIVQVSKKDLVEEEDTTSDMLYDTNSLHINLQYASVKKGQSKAPKNLRIYLIPDNGSNKNIIRDAKTYEMYCNELNLDKAKGRKIARFKDGAYKFYDVPPGKYLVKICTYYGGYYTYTRKRSGNDIVSWEAAPPVQ
ncbi:MAG TPA: hypothetical protein VF609_04840 [Flavisolibacter sp.]